MSDGFIAFNPEDIVSKKAITLDEQSIGSILEVRNDDIIIEYHGMYFTRRRFKVTYTIPKNLIDHFHRDAVYFKITKEEAKQYKGDEVFYN